MNTVNLPATLSIGNTQIHQQDGLYSLNDLHRASGGEDKHRPNQFLRNDQTQALITELETAQICAVKTLEGRTGGTYACRELVIAYAAWISAAFHLKVIRVFLDVTAPAQAASLPMRTVQFDVPAVRQATRWLVEINDRGKETVTEVPADTHILSPGHLTRLLMHSPSDLNLSGVQMLAVAQAFIGAIHLTLKTSREGLEAIARRQGHVMPKIPTAASLHGQINSLGQSDAAAAEVAA